MPTVQHMVLVKFKPDVTADKIDDLFRQLYEFWGRMSGVTYYAGGPYASPEGLNQGYTHGFLVTFDGAAARDVYLKHPEHQRVVELILPLLDGVMAFDFEVP